MGAFLLFLLAYLAIGFCCLIIAGFVDELICPLYSKHDPEGFVFAWLIAWPALIIGIIFYGLTKMGEIILIKINKLTARMKEDKHG